MDQLPEGIVNGQVQGTIHPFDVEGIFKGIGVDFELGGGAIFGDAEGHGAGGGNRIRGVKVGAIAAENTFEEATCA